MGLLDALLSGIDSTKRAVKNRLADMLTRPAGYAQMIDDQAKNYNANVQPTIHGGSLFNRALTQYEIDQKAIDLALNFGPMGVGTFIGKGAKTWDTIAMAQAQKMADSGVDPRVIWKETGTWKGPDGAWRQEIPDNTSQFTGESIPSGITSAQQYVYKAGPSIPLSDVFSHSSLMDAYPSARRIETTRTQYPYEGAEFYLNKRGRPNISIGSSAKSIEVPGIFGGKQSISVASEPRGPDKISSVLHELQHYIQAKEGFSTGGNAGMFYSSVIDPISGLRVAPPISPDEMYRRLAGEAEARATQARMNMDAAQRRAIFPEDSYDVPMDQLIIRGNPLQRAINGVPINNSP